MREPRASISAASGRKDVKPVEVGSSGDGAGVFIASPLGSLHAASGGIVARAENHAINAGTILREQANTQAASGNPGVEAKSSFHLNLIPEWRFPRGDICSGGDPGW